MRNFFQSKCVDQEDEENQNFSSELFGEEVELPLDISQGAPAAAWQTFSQKYRIRRDVKFCDAEIEEIFQNRLMMSKQSLHNSLKFIWVYILVCFFWAAKSYLVSQHEYRDGWFVVSLGLRALACIVGLMMICSYYLRWTKPFVQKYYNQICFWALFCGGVLFTSYLPMYITRTDPGYGTQTAHNILMCIVVRVGWVTQAAGVTLQLIYFVSLTAAVGYEFNGIGNSVAYIVLFNIIGFSAMYSMEMNLRIVFRQQQFSLFVVKQHAAVSRELAQQAQAANFAKSRFVANISHEIRTPLHGVITALDLLKSTQVSKEQEDYILVAETSSGLLLDILNNVLTLAKLEEGKVQLEKVPTDLRAVLEGVTVVFGQMASKKGVEVIPYVPPSCPVHLLSDPVRLKQMFFNLVSNAVKFTSSGHIAIAVEVVKETAEDVSLTMSVADSGTGVAPEHLHLLFQRFSQVDSSNTRRFQGTGLGLALVFEFAKLFDGSMSARSDGIGFGTTFSFSATFLKDPDHKPHSPELPSLPLFCRPISPRSSSSLHPPNGQYVQLSPSWVCQVIHKDDTACQIWASYLSHMGADVARDPSQLMAHVYSRLPSTSPALSQENSTATVPCSPVCLVVDSRSCSELPVLSYLRSTVQSLAHLSKSVKDRISNDPIDSTMSFLSRLRASTPPFPLFLLLLEEPVPPEVGVRLPTATLDNIASEARGLGLASYVFSVKKPCRLSRLEQATELMLTQLRSDFSKSINQAKAATSLYQRRRSTPFVQFCAPQKPISPRGYDQIVNDRRMSLQPGRMPRNRKRPSLADQGRLSLHNLFSPGSLRRRGSALAPAPAPMESDVFDSLANFKFGGDDESQQDDTLSESTTSPQRSPRPSVSISVGGDSDLGALAMDRLPESRLLSAFINGTTGADQPTLPTLRQSIGDTVEGQPSPAPSALQQPQREEPSSQSPQVATPPEQPTTEDLFRKILVADDNSINRKLTERLLSKSGFLMSSVENGALAVEAAAQEDFALIFMDITMPVMDGVTAAKLIRETQKKLGKPLTFICALSAAVSAEAPEEFSSEDFDFALPKPIKSQSLIEAAVRFTKMYRDSISTNH